VQQIINLKGLSKGNISTTSY